MMRVLPLLALATLATADDPPVLASHPGVPNTVNIDQVRSILLGRSVLWPDGTLATIVLVQGDPAQARLTDRSTQHLLNGWKRMVYTGNGRMPLVVAEVDEAMELIARTPGAFAILTAPASAAGVRLSPVVQP